MEVGFIIINILTKILYSQYFFCIVVSWILFKFHVFLSSNILFDNIKMELFYVYNFSQNPELWQSFKKLYIFISVIAIYIISLGLYNAIMKKFEPKYKLFKPKIPRNTYKEGEFKLVVGLTKDIEKPKWICINEKGLYQNILITGTIGTGKTSSALYPFTKQLIEYKNKIEEYKVGILILDVKGNYYKEVLKFAKNCGRENDVKIIEINGEVKYNPLHKPNLKPIVLANRLKTILLLFSNQKSTDSYWLDKSEVIIAEMIKFCRIYNDSYVTFEEIHKLVTNLEYLKQQINKCKNKFILGEINKNQLNDLQTFLEFFQNEYMNLDQRTLSIIKSEITRITQMFVMDLDIKTTFCSEEKFLNFAGFKELVDKGKIVILKMNIAEYKNISKIIAAYLKLDFQTEVMMRLTRDGANIIRPVCFISDEFQEYVTSTDSDFFAQSREAKCINIVATQSYTSLLNTLKDSEVTKSIIQNLINKIWFRTDDVFTIEQAQKQLGRVLKEKESKTIMENARESKYSYIFNKFWADKSNLSESVNISLDREYLFDLHEFTQSLKVFEAICFISDGQGILKPNIIKLLPIFEDVKINKKWRY